MRRPVADAEPRRLNALLDQPPGHVEVFEHLERARIDDSGARRVGACGLPVHHGRRNTLLDQRRGQRESARARSDDEDIGVVHSRLLRLYANACWHNYARVAALCQHLLAYTCWHAEIVSGNQGGDPGRGPAAVRRVRVRTSHHPGDRGRREHRSVDGDALLRQQGPVVRRGRRLRSADPRSVRRRTRTTR